MDITSMNDLPDELLVKIYKYLTLESILACENVCQRWNRLARDPSVWNYLPITYSGQENQKSNAIKTLQLFPTHYSCIRYIKMQYIIGYSDIITILNLCNNIIKLELSMCSIHAQFVVDIKMFPNLQLLHFPITFQASRGWECDIQYNYFKKLKSVNLPNFALRPTNFSTLLDCKHLSHIFLHKVTWLTRDNVRSLLLTHKDVIKSFHLYGGSSVDDAIFKLISECPFLKDLAIVHCEHLTDRALSTLKSLCKIRKLQLWNNNVFSEAGLIQTFKSSVFFGLKSLSLSRIKNVTPALVKVISDNYKTLTFLALYQCPSVTSSVYVEQLKIQFPNLDVVCS